MHQQFCRDCVQFYHNLVADAAMAFLEIMDWESGKVGACAKGREYNWRLLLFNESLLLGLVIACCAVGNGVLRTGGGKFCAQLL